MRSSRRRGYPFCPMKTGLYNISKGRLIIMTPDDIWWLIDALKEQIEESRAEGKNAFNFVVELSEAETIVEALEALNE